MQNEDSDFPSLELQHAASLHCLQLLRVLTRSHISRHFLRYSRRAQKHDSVLDNVALLEMVLDLTLHNHSQYAKFKTSKVSRCVLG